jgi:hypothetical protein
MDGATYPIVRCSQVPKKTDVHLIDHPGALSAIYR